MATNSSTGIGLFARAFTVERVPVGGTTHNYAAATAAVESFDTFQHRIGSGHDEAPGRRRLSTLNSWRPPMLPVPPILMRWLAPFARYGAGASFSLYVTHYPLLVVAVSAIGYEAR